MAKKEVSRTEIFESMSVDKAIITLAVPTIMNQLVNVIYNLADTFFVGKLNNSSMVAALTLSATIMILLTAFSSLFVIGSCAVISTSLGSGNLKRAKDVYVTAPILAFIVGAIITLIMTIFLEPISWLAGSTESCIEYTKQYLFWVIGINAIPFTVGNTIGACLRGRGYSKYEMLGLSIGNILNIILHPIFIFVFDLGVKGAAIATMLSATVSLVIFVVITLKKQKESDLFTSLKEYKFSLMLAKEILSMGFPAWLHQIVAGITNTMFMNLTKTYSDAAIAAVGISRKLEHVSGQFMIGLYQGVIPLISYSYGQKNFERLNSVRKRSLFYGMMIGVASMLVLIPFSRQFTLLFIKDEATVIYGILFVRIYSALPFTMSPNNNCRTVFQAIGMKKQSTRISILRNVILFVPVMYLLNHFFGIYGLILSNLISDIIVDIYALISMNKAMNRLKNEFNA